LRWFKDLDLSIKIAIFSGGGLCRVVEERVVLACGSGGGGGGVVKIVVEDME
jgi:hypothetical protein